jgi:hypothetical protein
LLLTVPMPKNGEKPKRLLRLRPLQRRLRLRRLLPLKQ